MRNRTDTGLWKSVEAAHRGILEAETGEEHDRALRDLERALDRLTREIEKRVCRIESRSTATVLSRRTRD